MLYTIFCIINFFVVCSHYTPAIYHSFAQKRSISVSERPEPVKKFGEQSRRIAKILTQKKSFVWISTNPITTYWRLIRFLVSINQSITAYYLIGIVACYTIHAPVFHFQLLARPIRFRFTSTNQITRTVSSKFRWSNEKSCYIKLYNALFCPMKFCAISSNKCPCTILNAVFRPIKSLFISTNVLQPFRQLELYLLVDAHEILIMNSVIPL